MTFELTDEDMIKYREWLAIHDKICNYKHNSGAIGGRITFSFTHTSLGLITEIECACGEKLDLTNYEEW